MLIAHIATFVNEQKGFPSIVLKTFAYKRENQDFRLLGNNELSDCGWDVVKMTG